MNISAVGKFLDQPLLISKLKDKTPKILCGAAAAYGIYDTIQSPKEERSNRGIKNAIILSCVVCTSLISAFGFKIGNNKIFDGFVNLKNRNEILKNNANAVDNFLQQNKIPQAISDILNKTKTDILNIKDTEKILSVTPGSNGRDELFNTLFSKKEELNAKEIFKETGRLSILGLMPVAAGVLAGITADKITNENTPKSASDKIKEGAYQFLANIFMCNVGAAGALFGAERLQKAGAIKPLTPLGKLGVIMGGIFVTGIIGGSFVANLIGKKILDPLFNRDTKCNEIKFGQSDIYNERKPEILDMALHTDDIATAGVLSGFKWIEPMLPLMYTISGYRAGIGYRNNEN